MTFELVAPAGTVALISVLERMLGPLAGSAPNLTDCRLKKLYPKISTVCPLVAIEGEIEVIIGTPLARKLVVLTLVPALVITVSGPLTAPDGTVTATSVEAT